MHRKHSSPTTVAQGTELTLQLAAMSARKLADEDIPVCEIKY